MKAIKYNGRLYIELDNLWQALYQSFNSAHNHQVSTDIFDKILSKPISEWTPFLKEEFKSIINKYNNLSAPRLDKISWKLFKRFINVKFCLNSIINIINVCINLGHWSSHFKTLTSIIILKLNKSLYDFFKFFWPIVLLNTLGKLIEKVIGERMQFHTISNNFVHPYQFKGLEQWSISDVGTFLIYIIWLG